MERLFLLLYKYRAFLLFVLIKNRTIYQQTKIVELGNEISGNINTLSSGFVDYFSLKDYNDELLKENSQLRDLLSQRANIPGQSISADRPPSVLQQYYYVPAQVINNSTNRFNNYITLNKGAIHGIKENMAVISGTGIVGKVEAVSSNFSTVISILHSSYYVSSKISPSDIQCTLKWNGENSSKSQLLYVPRHLKINIGDSVLTSGFNAIFPVNAPIGTISEVNLTEDATFYDLTVRLFTNFNALKNVYVVGNRLREEQLNLEDSLISN
jgi:rod shape-determining protein MreC